MKKIIKKQENKMTVQTFSCSCGSCQCNKTGNGGGSNTYTGSIK